MAFKAFFGSESRQLKKDKPKEFESKYASYKKAVKSRLKTFEKHGKGKSASAKKLKEALYDAEQAYTNYERSLAFSRMSLVLTSARGSYSKSLKIDRKIVAKLNEDYGTHDEKTGELIKPFITLKELEDFGEMMEEAKDSSKTVLYGSSQVARTVRGIMQETGGKSIDWRSLLEEYLVSKKYFKVEGEGK